MDEYEGMQDMSPEADDDEAEDRCPVPDDSDSDSGESDVDLAVPQKRGAEVAGGAGGAVRPRDDEDSDVASFREPGHSHKKARLSAFPAAKAWNRDAAYDAWQASARCDETAGMVAWDNQANPSRWASLETPQLEEASHPQEASEDDKGRESLGRH